jgi:hypothetical protein
MNIDQAASFLTSSILFGFGVVCLTVTILIVNNLFSKYWKPVVFTKYLFPATFSDNPPRFVDTVEPTMDKGIK